MLEEKGDMDMHASLTTSGINLGYAWAPVNKAQVFLDVHAKIFSYSGIFNSHYSGRVGMGFVQRIGDRFVVELNGTYSRSYTSLGGSPNGSYIYGIWGGPDDVGGKYQTFGVQPGLKFEFILLEIFLNAQVSYIDYFKNEPGLIQIDKNPLFPTKDLHVSVPFESMYDIVFEPSISFEFDNRWDDLVYIRIGVTLHQQSGYEIATHLDPAGEYYRYETLFSPVNVSLGFKFKLSRDGEKPHIRWPYIDLSSFLTGMFIY